MDHIRADDEIKAPLEPQIAEIPQPTEPDVPAATVAADYIGTGIQTDVLNSGPQLPQYCSPDPFATADIQYPANAALEQVLGDRDREVDPPLEHRSIDHGVLRITIPAIEVRLIVLLPT